MTTASTDRQTLRIGHSPDPDDAFMWWPLANFVAPDGSRLSPRIDTGKYDFEHILEDIQSLNVRSEKGELEITAISIHQYPYVADKYALTSCGSSMGDNYGPMIVHNPAASPGSQGGMTCPGCLKGKKLAIPGQRTTAWLATRIMLAEHGLTADDIDWSFVMFDQILQKVESGEYDAGLIIHEGQITYQNQGLDVLIDLGKWWTESRGLPLPLGGNCIRRDFVEAGEAGDICRILLRSIQHALDHREDAVAFALNYARDMQTELADRFVGMYVNDWTLDYGPTGRRAVNRLLKEGADAGIIPALPQGSADFIDPA